MISSSKERVKAHDLEFQIFLSEPQIQAQVQQLGQQIQADYADKKPIFLCVLNGAFVFAADLVRQFSAACDISFIKLSSYEGLQSSGKIANLLGLDIDLNDRHLIIVEDIIDTGNTMYWFLQELKHYQPASVALATLLVKPEALQHNFPIPYTGFEIPNKFVIGYGLDYEGEGRNLPAIYQLVEE